MKSNKNLILAAVALLIAATISGVVIMSKSGDPGSQGGGSGATPGGSGKNPSGAAGSTSETAAERARKRREEVNSELVARYGESRTNLSKHVTGNILGILGDAVEMGEMMTSGQAGSFGSGVGFALGRLNGELKLTPEQREKAEEMFMEYRRRQVEKQKGAIENLQKDPTPLMKLVLASDAGFRGEMTDEEYKKLQIETGKELSGVINPLDRKNFGGGSPLRDPEFVSGIRGILDPAQAEKLDAEMARRETEAQADPNGLQGVEEGNIASLPKMDIEKIDQSIESARKITIGIKSMMDGFGGLKDVIPPPPNEGGK